MKKRLMAFLLVCVMVVGMLPTTALATETSTNSTTDYGVSATAEGGSSGSEDGVQEEVDQSSGGTDKQAYYAHFGNFIRLTVTRIADDAASDGIKDNGSITQSDYNSAIKNSDTGDGTELIVDLVGAKDWGNLIKYVHFTDNSTLDYVRGTYSTGYNYTSIQNSKSSGIVDVSGDGTHFLVNADVWGRWIGSWGNLTFGYKDGSSQIKTANVNEFTNGTDTESLSAFFQGESSLTLNTVAQQFADANNSLFWHLDKLCNDYNVPLYDYLVDDAEEADSGNLFAAGFYSAKPEDNYSYLMTYETGALRWWCTANEDGTVTYDYADAYMTTVRDGVKHNNKYLYPSADSASGGYALHKVDSAYAEVMHLDDGGPYIFDKQAKELDMSGTPIWKGCTRTEAADCFNSESKLNSTGAGMWIVYGRSSDLGISDDTWPVFSMSKTIGSNLSDEYAEKVFGKSLSELEFPVTLTLDGLPSSVNGRSIWVHESSDVEDSAVATIGTVSGGSVTLKFNWKAGANYNIAGMGLNLETPEAVCGLYADELDGVTVTITEDLSAFKDDGMVGFMWEGDIPFRYQDEDDYSGGAYASTRIFDTLQTMDTWTQDGYAIMDENGILTTSYDLSNGAVSMNTYNMWVGIAVEKKIEGVYGGSTKVEEFYEQWKTKAATADGKKLYETYDNQNLFLSQIYACGYAPLTSNDSYWAADYNNTGSGYTSGRWAAADVSDSVKVFVFDDAKLPDGPLELGIDDMPGLASGPYVQMMMPVDAECLIVDPAFALHFLIVHWINGYGAFYIGENPTMMAWLTAEYGGTDTENNETPSYRMNVSSQYLNDISSYNRPTWSKQDALSTATCDEYMQARSSWFGTQYDAWLEAFKAADAAGPEEKMQLWGYEFPCDIFGSYYDEHEPVVLTKSTITNAFSSDERSGNCHIILDMNLNGKPLYELDNDGAYTGITASSTLVDCGTVNTGDVLDLTKVWSAISGQTYTLSATNTGSAGGTVTVTAKPTGIFEKADGGTALPATSATGQSLQAYTIQGCKTEPHEHVLFVQWTFSVKVDSSGGGGTTTPDPDPGTGGGGGEGSGDVKDSMWHTVYWDYGYTGGGVTSTQMGVTTHYATNEFELGWSINCNCTSANTEVEYVKVIKWEPYLISYELDVPARPERQGWCFLGWMNEGTTLETSSAGGKYPTDYPELLISDYCYINKLERILNGGGASIASAINSSLGGAKTFGYNNIARTIPAQQIKDYTKLADQIKAVIAADGEGADKLEGTTFRAQWASQYINWHSMGGTYVDRSESGTDSIKTANCWWESNSGGYASDEAGPFYSSGVTNSNGHQGCNGLWGHAASWCGKHEASRIPGTPDYIDDCETYIHNSVWTSETEYMPIVTAPVRTGYTFMGWFFDPYCSVPLTEFEIGIQPGRHYYAGWEAEDVIIEYYDTREGTGLIGTQTVSYADPVNLLDAVQSTSGWESVGWTVEPNTDGTQGDILDDNGMYWRANPGLAYDVVEPVPDNMNFLEICNATYYPATGSAYDDPADTGTWENEGYWVVKLYADYTIKTTEYTVDIHWDDYQNNDGCRPEAVHIGLITSVGNVLCDDAWVTGDSSEDTWTYTFEDLPITVSDSNTEVINYSFCVLGYRDANGLEAVVKDTQSSHGEMFMTTPTNNSTDASTLYRYDINLYDVGNDGSEHFYSSNEDDALSVLGSSDQSVVYTPYEGVLYMTHDLILTGDDIVFTIEWDDDSNRDGMRPEYVMLYLFAKDGNGGFSLISMDTLAGNYQEGTVAVTEAMCQVSEDGNTWTYTFEDYQKYTNEGELVIYGFTVGSLPAGYSALYMEGNSTGPDTNGVKLSYDEKLARVPVKINWHDNNNQDGLRPDSVTVQLIAYQWNNELGAYESIVVDTKTMQGNSTASTWSSWFDDEYVYHDGMPVTYRLAVSSDLNGNIDDYSNGYTWTEGIVGSAYLDGAYPSVDIYHNADEKSVTATVQWDDNYNNDEFRPDSVILQLYSHAPGEASVPVEGEEYRVNLTGDPTALTWTYTFENLEIYDPDQSGVELIYTVRVESARGGELTDYTAWYLNSNNTFVNSFNASSEPFVLLEYTPKVDTVNGVIYWQDESNRDGERAEFVDVKLMAYVYDETTNKWLEYVAASQTVTPATDTRNTMTADEWYFEFADMPVYRDTYPITYYLEITSDLNGNISETAKTYNWEEKARGNMHEDEDLEVSVTIYQRLEVLNVTATVEWNDDNNNDNLRPNAIVLQLYADGVRVEGEAYTVTLYGEPTVDTWTHTFENLPRYEEGDSGDEITYTIYAAELTEGSIYGEYDDTAITGEVYTFPKYVASYKTAVDGQYSEDLSDSVEAYVKLTHPNNEMDVPISIIWQDENNRDGQRPDYVTVRLMAYQWNEGLATWEYKEVATKTIKSDDVNHMTASEWTDTFGYHEMYHDGVKIIYHLQVTSNLNEFIPEGSFEYGWVESAYGNQTEAIPQVIISQNTNTTTVEATIYWDDSQNNDNIRPTNVIVQLYSHVMGETPEEVPGIAYRVNLTGDPTADNWYYTFSGMPRFAEGLSGVELIYTIKVIEADGEPLYGYYIIDANGEEEEVLRYEASYLMETGPETNETVNTTDFNESDRAYVRLEHITETKTMNFSVNWHDGDNVDNVRPDDISVDLYKTIGNGEPIYLQTIVITENAQGTWTYKITGLDGYEDGQPVKYTIEVPDDIKSELESIGYTTSTQDNIVHLYYTPETGSISTKLYWVDDEDNDGYRVDSVIATLYKNGVSTGKTIDLNETNDWSGTWTDLDVHYIDGTATGTDVVYNVVVEAPNGYTVSYNPESTTIEENEILYIQLTHEADLADVPVTVYWNDNSDNDGKRPDELKVMLLVDGEESYYTTVMTAENATTGSSNIWTYTFENLPVYRGDGEKIYYSVIVYDDATWEGEYDSLTTGTTLYLSHDMAMSTMYVSFQFNDNNNADGERPTGLYLQLTADGIPVDDSEYKHTVSFDTNVDGYTWNFGNLPVYKTDGTKIKYNVEVTFDEALGATDYSIWKSSDIELSESGDAAVNQIIVRLTKEANTTTHTGYIYWFDCNDLFGDRPDSLTLALQNNYSDTSVPYVVNAATGEVTNRSTGKVVGTVTVNEWTGDASVWTYTVSDLAENYINSAGQSAPIYYWVKANTTSIAQYYPTVFTGEDYGMDVALTHRYYEDYADAASQDYTVNLMWLDNSDAWGYRPDSNGVKLNLMANGELYDTRYLTSADAVNGNGNAWSYTWKDLPTYRGGAGIVWTVEAADVDAYTQEQTIETVTATTLTYFQSVGFNFTVNWDDSDNDDAVRPGNVVLNVFADGTQVGSVTMTGTENTWAGSISDLAVWRESDGDAAVQYTFQWADATAEYLSEIGYTAAPTLNGAAVEASNFYYLSASAFGDNTDAGYDVLDGTYEWETTLSYDKEIADYYFDVTFVDDVDRDGLRPSEMTVNLLADGVVIDSKVLEVNKTDSMYTVIWEDLEVWESGEAINYTIELPAIPSGYTAEYNNLHTDVTLTHDIILVDVTGTVNWDDATQLVDVFNAEGTYVRSYEQIVRTDVYVQLYADGVALGEPVFIGADTYGEGENLNKSASTTWADLYKYRDNGVEIVYTMEVYSDELQALLDDGHSMAYDFETKYEPAATITHDLYDIRGTVYYMYTYSEDFLLEGVPVTAYLQDTESGEYNAVASTITDENGTFEFLNLEQGLYIIRATYVYGEQTLAGTQGVELDRKDNNDNIIIVNRGAVNDSDYYQYTASGTAFYQTDATDDSTITPVPEDSVVLLYKVVDGQTNPEYIGMTQTDANGRYAFGGLTSAEYIVNVVFNYEGGVYTYDNGDALNDGLSFVISGADVAWPDIIKQVNDETDINDPEYNEPTPEEPDEPIPCVVNGYVFYADNGVHTTDPIEGVDVYVYVAETNVEVGKDTTDENGYWEVEGLPKGDYIAVYSYQGNASRVLLFTITNDDYNNGTYTAAPQYFDRQVEVPTGTIRGIVLDENGDATRALVAIYNDLGELQDFAYTDSFGFYEFTVTAGYDYNVRILAVEDEVKTLTAGDPDDSLTTLDYYVLSGTFHVDGIAQGNKLVAVYYETDGEYELITATLTDADGNFNVTVYEEGNYRVCPYINGEIFEVRNVSVGYQEERPQVTQAINGTYTVTGTEDYASLVLYKIVDSSVEKTVKTVDTAGSTYKLLNLDAGEYRLKLVDSEGNETWYYFTAPEGALVDVTYYVTISGSVLDENGNAIVGANVAVYDSNGELVGPETTILSDGGYSYSDLIEGEYTIVISSPNTTETLANKWTYEDDSYGNAYPNGMESDKEWVWNINAYLVTGKVTDQHGEPFAGAYVTFQDMLDTERQYVAITDENGEYKIGLAFGAYSLTSEYFWDTEHSYEGTGYTYVDLNGDMKNVNFTIYRHGLTIETVRKADGMIAPNADVSVYFSDGTLYWSGQTDENGQVTIDAFIGDYLIKGSYDGSKAVTTTATVAEDTTVVLELDSVVYITGTVFDANGEAVADGLVYYDNGEAFSGYVYTDDNGQYSIPVISADLGTFTLYATSGVSVGESVTIAVASDVIVDLTVDVAEATYTISGIVTDESGNRLADALVTMMWGNDKTNKVTTSTNSLGEYTFEVEDGTYYLTAEYEASNGNSYVTNAEYAVHVNGADVTQNLLVLMRYNVTVTVVDANGEIVPAATVHYTGAESGTDVTGEDGTVVLYLANGNYRFYASTESRTSKTVTVVVDGETNVELTLTNVGIAYEEPDVYPNELKIWGYVYNPDGWVVEGAEVELYKQDLETLEWNLVETKLTDAEGYYEFTGLDEGTYRVDSVYTYTTDCVVNGDIFVVEGYLTDTMGNPLSNNVVELYNEATGDLIATVYTEDDGYYRFDDVAENVVYRLYAVDATGEPVVDGAVTAQYTDYTIEDTVTDIAGNVVVGAQVIITDNEGNIVTTTITDDTGYYKVIVEDNLKTYTATVTYPASYEVDTETYQRDTTDRNAPYLMDSWYTIEGYVHDDDGNLVEGAIVILKDVTNTEIDRYVTEEDGYYIFDGLEDGIYYVEIVYNDTTEHIYEIDAETGGVTDVTPEPEEPEPTNINVVVTNFSTGTVIEPEAGWVEGYNEFIVDSALVCAVYMRNENDVLTKLFCEVAADGSYVFSGEFLEGDEIIVVTKGDADLDGYVTITDMARINQYLVGIYQFDEIQKLAAEADGDGYITITDMARINQYLVGLYSFSWDTF